MWFRSPLPADVRRALPLAPGEKVLAAAGLADDGWAVATTAHLLVLAATGGPHPVVQRPWADVDRAAFDPERSALTVEWVDATPDTRLPLADPDRTSFPHALRERVEWSVVLAETVTLPTGGQVKVAVRRGTTGALFSQTIAGPGVDLDRPGVADVVDAAEYRLRGASGLPL